MEKRENVILLVTIELILLLITGLLFFNHLTMYTIFFATFSAVMLIFILLYLFNNKDEKLSKLKNIMKTYDSVLVSSEELPNLKGKNILMISNLEDFIDAQAEIRKPIYYKRDVDSCSFVIVDNKEACVHILKTNKDVVSPLEKTIDELVKNSDKKPRKKSLLENIEKTTIIKLDNLRSYKVSPVAKGGKQTSKSFLERLRKNYLSSNEK